MAQQLTFGQTFWRIIGLAENVPLWAMTSIAVSFSVYSAYRSSTTANDLIWNTQRRNFLDESINKPEQIINESEQNYNKGLLRRLAGIRGYSHVIPDMGVPKGQHAHW